METTSIPKTLIPDTMERAIELVEYHKHNKTVFDLGDGLRGRINKINYFKHADGIDTVDFQPIDNETYRSEKRKLQDDFVVCSQEWINIIFGLHC